MLIRFTANRWVFMDCIYAYLELYYIQYMYLCPQHAVFNWTSMCICELTHIYMHMHVDMHKLTRKGYEKRSYFRIKYTSTRKSALNLSKK